MSDTGYGLPSPSTPGNDKESTAGQNVYPAFHGFWDKDPESTKVRVDYLKMVLSAFFLIIAVMLWCILPIYWGSIWQLLQHVHNLRGWIVDLDGGQIGQVVTREFLASNGPSTSMTWSVPPLSLQTDFDFEDAVVDEQAWVIITINANASSILDYAIASSNVSYDGSLAVTVWANEARNSNAYRIMYMQVTAILQRIDEIYAIQRAVELSSAANLSHLISSAPETLTQPLSYTVVNTRPFDVQIVNAPNFVGMIFLTIIAYNAAMMNYNLIMTHTPLYRRLKFTHLLLLRLCVTFVGFLVLSALYTLLNMAFHTPFTRWYGGSGVVIFWMMTWLAMLALGLPLEAMLTLLTTRYAPFFLLLWIILNLSSSFYPIELLPGVFRYGYGSPFYNFSRTVSALCFNTKNDMGLNFGVQLIWIAVSLCTNTAFQYLVRRRDEAIWIRNYHRG